MTARGNSRDAGTGGRSRAKSALLAGAALSVLALATTPALAQAGLGELGANVSVPEGTQLFLAADTVT